MPKQRIPLAHTIEFKIRMVEGFINAPLPVNRVAFCRGKSFSRTTLKYWEDHYEEMIAAVAERKRAKKRTVGGSGRVSPSAPVEDALCVWIKDQRRDERPVSMQCIIAQCMVLLPGFMNDKTDTARTSWCSKFMRRNGLTIRKISHSGRKKHPELIALKEAFCM